MQKPRFGYRNNMFLPDVVMTASSEATRYPKEFLLDGATNVRWRTTDVTSETLTIDFSACASVFDCTTFQMKGSNMTDAGTVKLEKSSNGGSSWTTVFSGVSLVSPDNQIPPHVTQFFSSIDLTVYTMLRVTLADSGNTDGFISTGNIYLGDYFELSVGQLVTGEQEDALEMIYMSQSPSLNVSGSVAGQVLTRSHAFEWLDETDHINLVKLFNSVTIKEPWFLCMDADDPDNTSRWVFFVQRPKMPTKPTVAEMWDLQMNIRDAA
jgi:hypothetical protein